MLPLTRLRRLDVLTEQGQTGQLSAASGLVAIDDYLHVIADDELTMATFRYSEPSRPGQLQRLLPGRLPVEKAARKRQKPDWEALLPVPASPAQPHGALLAFGSGSTEERMQAALLELDASGALTGVVSTYSLRPFYSAASRKLEELNVEAVFLKAGRIHFVSRGNRIHPISCVIACEFAAWLAWLFDASKPLPALTLTSLTLPSLNDVVASVSDAVALTNGWLATAIAEATDDRYQDGPCVGAALAQFDERHRLIGWWPLAEPVKIEGLAFVSGKSGPELLLVNDPDDARIAAELFSVRLPV
ncbi:hypothetical protein HPT27_03330 [Permianibacter sp. IMCC34836]|uniref:DUF6929 family protein n=1 Tax=Permianibacter fluminis TaxID=2738515 RepID=UPI001551AD97|nr:hypothetical protein [Permianibacter fluminis]NQD36041.1 hypothetical protein [Permianibacter fluminis]